MAMTILVLETPFFTRTDTNGAYRLHPVEWNIGEAAGALAAFCRSRKAMPRQVRNDTRLLADFQQTLRQQGFELEWPRLRPL